MVTGIRQVMRVLTYSSVRRVWVRSVLSLGCLWLAELLMSHCGPRSEPWVWTRGRRGPQTNALLCNQGTTAHFTRAMQHSQRVTHTITRDADEWTCTQPHILRFKGTVHTKIKFMCSDVLRFIFFHWTQHQMFCESLFYKQCYKVYF